MPKAQAGNVHSLCSGKQYAPVVCKYPGAFLTNVSPASSAQINATICPSYFATKKLRYISHNLLKNGPHSKVPET